MLGKLIGGILGFTLGGGPIGALIGVGLGSLFDKDTDVKKHQYKYRGRTYTTTPGDFAVSLLVLSAAVMKADGKVVKSELEYVKTWFRDQFGVEKTKDYMLVLKDLLEKDIPLRDVSLQIRANMSVPNRLQLIQYLCGICISDGHVDPKELQVIHTIAHYLGINQRDLESIKAMFFGDGSRGGNRSKEAAPTSNDYRILELDSSATDIEIKKAFRKLAIKYHPDKVANLGEEHQHAAKEKFQKLNEAYERICKKRGIK